MTLALVVVLLIIVVTCAAIVVHSQHDTIARLEGRLRRRKRAEIIPSTESSIPPLTNRSLPDDPMRNFLP